MTLSNTTHRILVLGAGYTGMMAAIRAAGRTRRHGGAVTLVNPSPRFTERLRLHQVATGQRLGDHRIADLLSGTGAEFVEGRAVLIDPEERQVRVEGPGGTRLLGYDTLVYAIGGLTDVAALPGTEGGIGGGTGSGVGGGTGSGVGGGTGNGAGGGVHTLDGPREAARLASRLAGLASEGGGTVAVCGGGLTGVETAAEIAESYPSLRVVLLSRGRPGAMMGDGARRYLEGALARLGVEVRAGTDVVEVLPDVIRTAEGEPMPYDVCVRTAGVRVSPLATEAGIATDERGRIVTDATLRSISHPSVYAVGDAAAVPQSYGVIHGTCQSGIPTGAHAADSIGRELRGLAPRPFRFGYIHQPVSLGRRDAVIQFTRPDDTPRRAYLTGRPAVVYKELVSGSPLQEFRLSRRFAIPSFTLWTRGGRGNRLPA